MSIKRNLFGIAAAGAGCAAFMCGCIALDAEQQETLTKVVHEVIFTVTNQPAATAQPVKPSVQSAAEEEPAAAPSVDGVDFSALRWRYGGFDGSNAKLADGVRIKDLTVTSDRISYAWAAGGCERLGASSREDAACIAAFFCRVDGEWVGGKFEWISTSRQSRDTDNLRGYNGWSETIFNAASAYAFVIVSRDGRKRSNVITQGL